MTLLEYHYLPTFYMQEPLKTLFSEHRPKEGYKIMANQSVETGRYVAAVYKDVIVNRFNKDTCEAATALIIEADFKAFQSKIQPYIIKR